MVCSDAENAFPGARARSEPIRAPLRLPSGKMVHGFRKNGPWFMENGSFLPGKWFISSRNNGSFLPGKWFISSREMVRPFIDDQCGKCFMDAMGHRSHRFRQSDVFMARGGSDLTPPPTHHEVVK